MPRMDRVITCPFPESEIHAIIPVPGMDERNTSSNDRPGRAPWRITTCRAAFA